MAGNIAGNIIFDSCMNNHILNHLPYKSSFRFVDNISLLSEDEVDRGTEENKTPYALQVPGIEWDSACLVGSVLLLGGGQSHANTGAHTAATTTSAP